MSVVNTEVKNKVAVITYNNPPLNILTMENLQIIEDAVAEADQNDEVAVIVFTMAMQKKVFCAGMDLDEMLAAKDQPGGVEAYCADSKRNYSSFYRANKPTLYAYDGVVRGGGLEMSLFADFRFAGEAINIALPEINIGIIPGGGGTQTLARIIGEPRTKELIFTGKALKGEQVKEVGLVSDVFPSDSLMDNVIEFAEKMAENSPLGLQAAKRAIHGGRTLTIEEGLQHETEVFVGNFETQDAAEGITAFREKREPVYINR